MLRVPAALIPVGLLLFASACKDSTGPKDDCSTASSVTATVGSGRTPTFNWSPACAVAIVLVEDDDGGDQWAINMPLDDATDPQAVNKIRPPVTYGVVPTGIAGLESETAEPLVTGRQYKLVLWQMLPSNSTLTCQMKIESFCLLVVKEFVP